MPQNVVIENPDYFYERERRSDVAALALVDRLKDQPAQMEAALVELLILHPPEIGRIGRFDRVVHAPRRTRACGSPPFGEHDPFRKPVPTFRDHALGNRPATIKPKPDQVR